MEDSPEKICLCNGGVKIGSSLKRCQVTPKSCKNCGGRCTVDELESLKAKTFSTMALGALNPINPELNWNNVPKGRRSRKSIARSFNGVAKVGDTSPERVCDFSGSDSDKFGETVMGEPISGKSEHIPIKKRRHLLQSPAPQPWTPTLHPQDSSSPPPHFSSHPDGNKYQLRRRNRPAGQRSLNLYPKSQSRGIDGSAGAKVGKGLGNGAFSKRVEGEYLNPGDFSGIELLAAAASMEGDADSSTKEDPVVEDASISKSSDATCLATLCKLGSKSNESGNSSSIASLHKDHDKGSLLLNDCAAASQSPHGSMKDGTTPECVPSKEDRRHWDLNILMDAWDEPYEDSTAGSNSKGDPDFDTHVEGKQEGSEEHVVPNPGGTEIDSKWKREDMFSGVASNRTCTESPGHEELLLKPASTSHSSAAGETAQAIEKVGDGNNSNQVMKTDAILDSSFTKLHFSSSMLTSEGKKNTLSANVAIVQDEDSPSLHCSSSILIAEDRKNIIFGGIAVMENEYFSSNMNGYDGTKATEISASVARKQDTEYQKSSELPGSMVSLGDTINSVTCKREYVYNPKSNSDEVSCFSSSSNSGNVHSSGTFAQDGQSVVAADSKIRNVGTFVAGSTIVDCKGQFKLNELVAKHELIDLSNERSQMIKLEDSCNSYSAREQFDDSTMSPGQVDSTVEANADSPYEDGELRGSFLSWEENECIDFEFDGRNGDGSDAANYHGSEIVEGVSDGSHGTERRSSTARTPTEGNGSKNGSGKHFLRKNFMEDDSKNDEIGGKKESNGGSGTTVEQFMEVITEETDDVVQKRHLTDRRDPIGGKTLMGGCTSRMAWGKFQSHVEGGSSSEATNGRDAFFDFRSCRLGGSYGRERDISPEKYVDRCRPAAYRSEKDGVAQWTNWGSKGRYTSTYRGTEGRHQTRPRIVTYDSGDKFRSLDFHDQRQNANYFPKGSRRPFEKMRSPVDRDDSFGVHRRIHPTQGITRSRNSGNFAQSPRRDFVDDFEPIPNAAASVRLSCYMSKRERSFSPSSGRGGHVPLTHRRSRSRSRTRLPTGGNFYREREFGCRRQSRSPDFRSEARMERMRAPFPKPTFASDGSAGYMSTPRGRSSPQSNCRWSDDHNKFENNNFRRKRLTGVSRYSQRGGNPSVRINSDEYFRPMIRPGRFPFVSSDGRDCKFEDNYVDRKREDRGEMMLRRRQQDDGGNFRRFRQDAGDDVVVNNSNNEEDVRGTDRRDVPLAQSNNREDKRAFITLT